jgi:hypothetical protein
VITLEKKISIVDFKESLPDETTREVGEDEKLCDTCGGFGVIHDKSRRIIKTCPNCLKGKVKICKQCGKKIERGRWRCDCSGAKKEYQKEKIKKALKKKEKATKVDLDYIIENNLFMYDDINREYIPDIEDDINIDWAFATNPLLLTLNAEYIMENALEGLHESVYDAVEAEDYNKLQKVCDEINEKYKGYRSYYPDFSKWVDLSEYTK